VSRLSFDLAALEQAGMIRSRRVARHVIYSVDANQIGQTTGCLLNHCCGDHPTVRASCAQHPTRNQPIKVPPEL